MAEKHKKSNIWIVIVSIIIIFAISIPLIKNNKIQNTTLQNIKLPPDFKIDIFASDLGKGFNLPGPNKGARFMEFYKDVLFVSIPSSSMIVALHDKNKDGKVDEIIKVIDNLNRPHGIAFKDNYMYVANENSLIKTKLNDDLTADKSTIEHVNDLPKGGHWTRTIRIKDNELYISIGSSCNVCIENDERRASIMKCNLDNGKCDIYAKGIRNAVGFVFHPETNEMYATENSRDLLGEDLPPDEINIVKEGKNYGWPICYGKNIHDGDFDKNVYIRNPCMEPFEEPSFIDLQAHSAPLGLAFYFGKNFPEEYKGDLFVAYHGSWNRKIPTGYRVVRIDIETKQVHDFATGWLTPENKVLGRPVDIIFDKEGIMYVSDDNAGVIYRVWYEK
ncbi:PQQ-dependent sugar dehydrogenase [Candidatus Woesearchaeota archaeon]|nr:PQQ-dependent sugar dehydrogenase [Candidatus Woesearchaeota archaeon]